MGLYSRYTTDKDGKRVRKDDATIKSEEMPKHKKQKPEKSEEEAPKKPAKKSKKED